MTPYELAAVVAAASPISRPFAQRAAQLFFRFFRPTTDRGGTELADVLFPERPAATDLPSLVVHWKACNTALLLVRTDEVLQQEKIDVREVPHSWVLPLLDAASNVDDVDLREFWARLLASGVAADEHQHPMWVKILAQMSMTDAREFLRVCARTDARGIPFVSDVDRHYGGVESPSDSEFRLVVLGLAIAMTSGRLDVHSSTAGLSQLGAQFRRAVMPRTRG